MKLLPFDYSARNAGRNPVRTALILLGGAGVVFLIMLMGAFVESLGSTVRNSGDPHNVLVVGSGSEDFLEQSEISPSVPTILASSVRQVARQGNQALISPEIDHSTMVRLTSQPQALNAPQHLALVRGVTPKAFLVHRQVYLTSGTLPRSGEILVGNLAAKRLNLPDDALQVGKKLYFEGRLWSISGAFSAPGTVFDSELWAPLEDLKVQTKRDSLTCAVVRLSDPKDYSDLNAFCKTRLDLELSAVPETEYYGSLAKFYRPMQWMGWVMSVLVGVSGLFGGLNVMIASINGRTRELACLETLGFSRRAIVCSLLQESLVQLGTAALLAAGLTFLVLHHAAIRFTMGALSLDVTGTVLLEGFAAAMLLAFAGTLIPAFRFVRRPLIEQLR